MSTCEVQAGFFVLSPCGRSAGKTCGNCGNYCCDRHGKMVKSGDFLCVECNAKQHAPQQKKDGKGKHRYRDDDWDSNDAVGIYLFRNEFYWAETFRPFSESDYAGFDQRESFSGLDDELGEGGFFDS